MKGFNNISSKLFIMFELIEKNTKDKSYTTHIQAMILLINLFQYTLHNLFTSRVDAPLDVANVSFSFTKAVRFI